VDKDPLPDRFLCRVRENVILWIYLRMRRVSDAIGAADVRIWSMFLKGVKFFCLCCINMSRQCRISCVLRETCMVLACGVRLSPHYLGG